MDDRLVLVTGAAGFIGSNVARAFAGKGWRVVACDRPRQGVKWRNLGEMLLYDFIVPEALLDWLARHRHELKLLIHMGAISATTETDVDRILRENVRTTLDLWEWSADNHVPFIYASSAATYGDGRFGFHDNDAPEALAALLPLNAYGWSKHLVDRRIISDVVAGRPTPPFWAGLKFFNVYGPGEDHKGEMRSLVNKLLPIVEKGGPVQLFKSYRSDYQDGGQMRDFVFIDDVVSVIAWLSEGTAPSSIYNVGSGQARSWNDLAQAVFSALKREPKIEYIPMPDHLRDHYQYFTEALNTKLRAAGWAAPSTGLEEGVRLYAASKHYIRAQL